MKTFGRIVLSALLVLLVFGTASAHAKLIKASPSPNSVLAAAPTQLQLWFDEPLDLAFSDVQVTNERQQRVDQGKLQTDPTDAKSIIVPLKPIGDGTYTVVWKVLSAADGHITRGVYAFGVGNATGQISAPVDTNISAPSELSVWSAMARWVALLALLALVGAFIFRAFLLERSLDAVNADAAARAIAVTRWRQLVLVAFALFFIGNFADLILQVNLVADQFSFDALLGVLINSRYGTMWLLRVGLIAACAILFGLDARGKRVPYGDSALIVLANVALITRSLNSHAASSGNLSLPVFADWLHMLGVAIWVGGLFCFAWVLPFVWRALEPKTRGAWIAWFVPQFSVIAIPATFVIFMTGVYGSVLQIPALDIFGLGALPDLAKLTGDIYVNALLLKIILFGVMLLFGALNFLWLSPRFRKSADAPEKNARVVSRFRLTLFAEVVLGLAAIFLAGVLTLSVPPRSAPEQIAPAIVPPPQIDRPLSLVGYPAENVRVQLEIGPKPNAPNVFDALVTDASGNALSDVQRVIFNFMYLNQDTGAQNVNAEARAENHYVADGQFMPLEGMWKIKVTVRQKGLDDVAIEFPYFIEPRFADESRAPVMTAQLVLQKAQAAMNALTTLRAKQDLNDGAGNVAISLYEYQMPDRTRFSIQGQGESIAIGSQQYYQDKTGNWFSRTRVEPFVFPNFDFADTAIRTREGRADKLGDEPAQIYLFDTPSTSGQEMIHYAYWIDAQQRVRKIGMVAASHFMIETYQDFNSDAIAIVPPENVSPAPTVAPVSNSGSNNPLAAAVQGNGRPRGFITGDLEGDGALILVVVGVVILLVGSGGKNKKRGKAQLVTLVVGAASVVAGVALFIDAVNGMQAAAQNVPVNLSRASSGQQIYEQNCAVCHGEKGYGDGPAAQKMQTKPFDLTTHVLLHDEQYLHAVILNGRGEMPAWGDKLSQDQILDVIAYTRLLARNAQQARPNATPARAGFTPQP